MYNREKKKLLLTGAGMLLMNMDASNLIHKSSGEQHAQISRNMNWILLLQHKECHSTQCQDFKVLLHMIFERICSWHCSEPPAAMKETLLQCLDVTRRLLQTTMP
ncbi:uncharacterized protein UBRO_21065 [Ustilago bromivora]|uniref:Uncharacterized protein n=1 Tax=Ustilago bromivora TaxID=307758 RepID=A0A1K0H2H3_9BASI|nr:uncharacterized protein UBRO_21065 [Ustilago bromivora]